jgi:hypothetical protein
MPPCGREHLDGARFGNLEGLSQVTDHADRALGQSQLDLVVQILHDITKPAYDLKDRHLTDGVPSDLWHWTADSPRAG